MRTCLLLLPLLLATLGCTGSRWAKADADYATKYPRHTSNIARTIKQAVDARHLRGKGGMYASLGGRNDPGALGGEAGVFHYLAPHLEGRMALAGLAYTDDEPATMGLLVGGRLQSPSRLAPYVGLGGYVGSGIDSTEANDGIDNNFDGFIDDSDENQDSFTAALIPEAGCHYWLNAHWRLTGSASYYITTSGTADDFLMFSISLARLNRDSRSPGTLSSTVSLANQAKELGWEVGDGPGNYYPPPEAATE